LNGVIRALEAGQVAFSVFSSPDIESALALSTSEYDSLVFEGEHNPWDVTALRHSFQYLLNRRQLVEGGTLAPSIAPFVRVPPNGAEMSQVFAKQALDLGAYGIIWPHISDVAQAYNAVAACRYPRLSSAPIYEPQGIRGDGPTAACRYWGLTQQVYYQRADVWPLNPDGEIFVILMIEDTVGIANLPDILENVPGVGAVLIGEGDLSQELGYPRQYEHPEVLAAMGEVVATCKRFGVAVGHPHVDEKNAERILSEGYTFLMTAPVRSYRPLERARELAGR
jgi:4-hydroxy-2-oxoheptanedioate aldolase